MASAPEKIVAEIGKQLAQRTRPPPTDFLVAKLTQAGRALSQLDQLSSLKSFIRPLCQSLVKHDLLHHKDKEVKLQVAICACEIIRILAPDPSFDNKTFKDIFELFVNMFTVLANPRSAHFESIVKILETIAALECCRHMLDLGCDDLILKMFNVFFSVVRNKHQQNVTDAMLSIMSVILNEGNGRQPLLEVVLHNLSNRAEDPAPASYHLAVSLIQNCTEKIKPAICGFLTACILDREKVKSDVKEAYHEIIFEIFQCAPSMVCTIIPNLIQELVADQVDVRIKSVNLIGRLLMLRGDLHEHNLFVELLKRFSDKSAEVRVSVIHAVKTYYKANPYAIESQNILSSLEAHLLDFDASVRTEAVKVVCDLARFNLKNFPDGLITRAIDRLRDKMASVRKEALKQLLEVYRDYCNKCFDRLMMLNECYEQIPCKILMLSLEKNLNDLRPPMLELLLAENLFPSSLSVEQRTIHWIYLYSLFTPAHIKALNSILCQKRRFQREMQSYLSLRRKAKEIDPEEVDRRIKKTFSRMSIAFLNTVKAEASLYKLNELKDNDIFDLLQQLLDEPALLHAKTLRDRFLKKIGEKHPHFEFLQTLSLKCSNTIFSSEHVHSILKHVSESRCRDNHQEESAVNLLSDISRSLPLLFRGSEHQLKLLILEDDFPLRGKLIHILANVGSCISMEVSEIYPVLEMLSLEGTCAQAKSAISAIAALVDPSEGFLVENLCQKLVQSLYEGSTPTVLQSLGCISQHFVSEFEKHRNEVSLYIRKSIFEATIPEGSAHSDHISGYEVCFDCEMKICGLKALVKSVLPKKEVHGKEQLSILLDVLYKLLLTAKFAEGTTVCVNDLSRVKLVAAKSVLRLSRWWGLHISPQIFRLTVMMAKDDSRVVRRAYIEKIRKLLKEHALSSKFACAFALVAASDCVEDLKDVSMKYLVEFIEEYGRADPTCPGSGTEGFSTSCAAYVVVFLLHVLAHDAQFPSLDSDSQELFAQFCRPLVLLLCLLVDVQRINIDGDLVSKVHVYLQSIFRAVKRAEDAVDAEKTPKLHILANIGISVLNAVNREGISLTPAPGQVLLPLSLYKIPSARKAEDNLPTVGFTLDEKLVMKLIDAFKSEFTQLCSTTAKQSRKCLDSSLQDENNVDFGISKQLSKLSRNLGQKGSTAEKDTAESHILEACIRGKEQTKIAQAATLTTMQLQDASSAVEEELASDDLGTVGHSLANDKLESHSANVELFGTVSDISTEENSLMLERKSKATYNSSESPKLSKTKRRHGCTSDGSTTSLVQQCDPKKRRFGDNVKATVSDSRGVLAEKQRAEVSKRKILADRTNTLSVNGSQEHCPQSMSPLTPKISVDITASDVSDVGTEAIAYRTRRRKA